ncbi:MAG TPA: ROK family protein [Ruminiclostridium sp.]
MKLLRGFSKKNCRKADQIEGIGISCGGPLDRKRGIIMSPPNLLGWDNIPIVEILEKRFAIKTLIDILNPEDVVIGSILQGAEVCSIQLLWK